MRLGFANWSQIENFEKENRFVKRLRQSYYRDNTSKLIYQNLTRKEKFRLRTYLGFSYNLLLKKGKITQTRIKDLSNADIQLIVQSDQNDDFILQVVYIGPVCHLVLERCTFSNEQVHKWRKQYYFYGEGKESLELNLSKYITFQMDAF